MLQEGSLVREQMRVAEKSQFHSPLLAALWCVNQTPPPRAESLMPRGPGVGSRGLSAELLSPIPQLHFLEVNHVAQGHALLEAAMAKDSLITGDRGPGLLASM